MKIKLYMLNPLNFHRTIKLKTMLNKLRNLPTTIAIKILSRTMKKHPDYAWAWHCNIAMVARDAGGSYKKSQIMTNTFMETLFGVTTWPIIDTKEEVKRGNH